MIRRWFLFVTSHPLPILVIMGIIALAMGLFMLRLVRESSPDAFIPSNHPALLLKQNIDERFGLRDPLVVAVIRDAPHGVFVPPTLKLIRDLTEDFRKLPGVESRDVMSLATESGVLFDEDGMPGFHFLLNGIPERREDLDSLRDIIMGYELYQGTLVSIDGSAATIIIRLKNDVQAEELYRDIGEILEDYPTNGERLVVAGEAAVRTHMGTAVSNDAFRMNFVCPVVMALLLVLAYRTGRGTVLPLSVIGGASALALGLMSISNVPIFIVTNGIFVVIMALGMADSLHFIGQYYEEQSNPAGRGKQQIIVDSCMALWFPVLVTTLTDMAGFLALYVVGVMPPIRYFGLFTAIGVLGALAYSYTVIPAGLSILPLKMSRAFLNRKSAPERNGQIDALGRYLGRIGVFVYKQRLVLYILGILLVGAALWGSLSLEVNDARILAFKDHHPIVQATRELNERFDGTCELNVVVTASEERAFLQPDVLRRIEALEAYSEGLPLVGGTHSISGWVKRAHMKMNQEDPAYYSIPDDPFDTEFYLDVLGDEASPMARSLHETIDNTYTEANLIVRMKSGQFIHQRDVVLPLQDYLDQNFGSGILKAKLAGRANLDYHWLYLVRSTHIWSVVFSLGCVLLLTGLMFRSVLAGLLCGFPVAVAVIINYAIMGVFDIPLGVGTSMFASIAIGAGVNFPIHLLDRLRIEFRNPHRDINNIFRRTLAFTGRALFFTAFVVAGGFLLLCISEFRTLVRFGLLIGLGMTTSYIISVTVLPPVIAIFKPSFIYGQRKQNTLR